MPKPKRVLNVDAAVTYHRGRKGAAVRDGHAAEAEAADRDLRIALLEKRLREMVEHPPPPLTPAVRDRLFAILAGALTIE